MKNRISRLQKKTQKDSKTLKIAIFPTGLTHGFGQSQKIEILSTAFTHRFGPKMSISPPFIKAIKARKRSFTIFQNEKTPFQAVKTRSSKSPKIHVFPKGLTHVFGPQMAIFPTFFGNIGQENVFYDILERKTPFQAIKKSSKSQKIEIFSKRLTDGFGPKMAIFPTFIKAIKARKMSFTIFQKEKTPLQAIKTRSSKSQKIDIFLKGLTHGFGPKMAIFPTFFFRQYRLGKCLLRYARTRKRLSSFSKGVKPWFWSKNGHLSNCF